jgi:hypothetical protein
MVNGPKDKENSMTLWEIYIEYRDAIISIGAQSTSGMTLETQRVLMKALTRNFLQVLGARGYRTKFLGIYWSGPTEKYRRWKIFSRDGRVEAGMSDRWGLMIEGIF